MKRRNFLSCLPFLAPAVVAAVPKEKNPDDFEWEGYQVKWRDYVGEQASDRLEGFWTAWPIRKEDRQGQYRYIVSMTSREWTGDPIVSRYNPGNTFRMGCRLITRLSSESEKAAAKAESLAALKQFILDEEKPKEEPKYSAAGYRLDYLDPQRVNLGGSYDTADGFDCIGWDQNTFPSYGTKRRG